MKITSVRWWRDISGDLGSVKYFFIDIFPGQNESGSLDWVCFLPGVVLPIWVKSMVSTDMIKNYHY